MNEQDFKKMMQDSKLEIQFPDFEEQVMEKIHEKEANRRSVWRSLKMSWIFFFIGAFFSLALTSILVGSDMFAFSDYSNSIILVIEVAFIVVIASQFDSLIRFTFKRRE